MKAKTHQSSAKRYSITAGGKIRRKHAAVSHLRVNKSPRQTGLVTVSHADVKRIKRVLPYA